MTRGLALICAVMGGLLAGVAHGADGETDLADVFSLDVARYRKELLSELPVVRTAGVQGLSHLRHHSFERDLIAALDDQDASVRREAAFALGRLGRRAAAPPLIDRLDDESYEVRAQAAAALTRVTVHRPPAEETADRSYWKRWWEQMTPDEREASLILALKDPSTRGDALRGLRRWGGTRTQTALIELAQITKLGPEEIELLLEALEPVATRESLGILERFGGRSPAAAWALGNIGGPEALRLLVDRLGAYGLVGLINLDRLHWKGAFAHAPRFVRSFGLVSYRSQPDDLHHPPTPRQRLTAQLLLRCGRAPEIVDVILSKLDGQPATLASKDDSTIQALLQIASEMDEELKPGFHRADGDAKSTPLCAMAHLVQDPGLTPRLIELLDHPAYVVRVYAAKALAKLRAQQAAEPIGEILRAGYPFEDAAHQVSGKHGPKISRFVRWKGYLAMSLGEIGGDRAREILEELVIDESLSRDVRMGAAVGLGTIADERSRDSLTRATEQDVVRWIRETARRSLREIELRTHVASAETKGD